MNPVENVNLQSVVGAAATELLDEKRRGVAGIVKQILQRSEQLAGDVKGLESQLAKKRGQLEQSLAKVEKLRAGDWSVLQEVKAEAEQQ